MTTERAHYECQQISTTSRDVSEGQEGGGGMKAGQPKGEKKHIQNFAKGKLKKAGTKLSTQHVCLGPKIPSPLRLLIQPP